MGTIQFTLQTTKSSLEFRGDDLTQEQIDGILEDIIKPQFSKRNIREAVKKPNSVKIFDEIVNEANEVENYIAEVIDTTKNEPKPSKKLAFIDSAPRTMNSMEDLLGDQIHKLYPPIEVKEEDQPSFYHTGVKYKTFRGDTDVPHYRTHYSCPKCASTGRHYIPDANVKYIACHTCQTKLSVDSATDKGFGFSEDHRDDYGNFFVARTMHIDNTATYLKY